MPTWLAAFRTTKAKHVCESQAVSLARFSLLDVVMRFHNRNPGPRMRNQ